VGNEAEHAGFAVEGGAAAAAVAHTQQQKYREKEELVTIIKRKQIDQSKMFGERV